VTAPTHARASLRGAQYSINDHNTDVDALNFGASGNERGTGTGTRNKRKKRWPESPLRLCVLFSALDVPQGIPRIFTGEAGSNRKYRCALDNHPDFVLVPFVDRPPLSEPADEK
jgi:hypothetical protein